MNHRACVISVLNGFPMGFHVGQANLVGSQADLGGSDFSKSDLTGASLEGANLEDVSFENVASQPSGQGVNRQGATTTELCGC